MTRQAADARCLKKEEEAAYQLRALFRRYGYSLVRMSRFEEYDLYVRNRDFLPTDSVIAFSGGNGKMLALRPDVTLSILKNAAAGGDRVLKLQYGENVYRYAREKKAFREIMQAGLECIGDIGGYEICESAHLACESLALLGGDFVLDLSHMGLVSSLMDEIEAPGAFKEDVMACLRQKNSDGVLRACGEQGADANWAGRVKELSSLFGSAESLLPRLRGIFPGAAAQAPLDELALVCAALEDSGFAGRVNIDLSVIYDAKYYSGIVFKGYLEGLPEGVLSGGQYDNLMKRMGKKGKGIGFAVYLDQLRQKDHRRETRDVDFLLQYGEGTDARETLRAARRLSARGSVFAGREAPAGTRYGRLVRLAGGGGRR